MPFYTEIRDLANAVRGIDLTAVLRSTGAKQDKLDKNKWNTCQGIISVTCPKFMNWSQGVGGGGAIDLVIHLKRLDFKTAVLWLSKQFPETNMQIIETPINPKPDFKPPQRDDSNLGIVIDYLMFNRYIPASVVKFLFDHGLFYADTRQNAVFLLLGKENRVVGAELRGTGNGRWTGMVQGSDKKLGYFSIKNGMTNKIILCESAIDAISCWCIIDNCTAISTSGITSNPQWLPELINQRYQIFCAFDSDFPGDCAAKKMIDLYPVVKRLRPCKHDWNDVLIYILSSYNTLKHKLLGNNL